MKNGRSPFIGHIRQQQDIQLPNKVGLSKEFLFNRMLKFAGKYEISIQFWGESNTNVFIAKDGIELTDFGGLNPDEAIAKTVEYLERINQIKT